MPRLYTGIAQDQRGRYVFLATSDHCPDNREARRKAGYCDQSMLDSQAEALRDIERVWLRESPELPVYLFDYYHKGGARIVQDTNIWIFEEADHETGELA